MEDKLLVYGLIQTVIFLLPLAVILYSQGCKEGKREQKMTEIERDLNGLGEKVGNLRVEHNTLVTELRDKIDTVDKELTKISASMEFIKDAIRELKQG